MDTVLEKRDLRRQSHNGLMRNKKYIEVQRNTKKYKEVRRSTEKYEEVHRSTKKCREVRGSTEVRLISLGFLVSCEYFEPIILT